MSASERVKLAGVLPQTASSATIDRDGNLVVELYDFSDAAQKWLGCDVAFVLRVPAASKADVLARLVPAQPPPAAADVDELLLRLIGERFTDYHGVKEWLDEHGIPYRKEFEPWA